MADSIIKKIVLGNCLHMLEIRNKHILATIVLIYSILFIIVPQSDYEPADIGSKIRQVKDFVKHDYRSFAAVYNGSILDPDKKFFPVSPPFAYRVNNEMQYSFPFYVTLINTPLYLLAGIHGMIFLSLVAGIVTLIVSLQIARLLKISEENIRWLLIFLGFASVIPLYSIMAAEYTLSILLVTLSIYFVLRGNEKKSSVLYALAGFSAGASVFLRIELGLFCVLLFLGVLVFKIYTKPMSQVVALFSSLALCAVILVSFNYYVTGNIFGLRGIAFTSFSGKVFTLSERLVNLFIALFYGTVKGFIKLGLFLVWPLYLFILGFFIKRNWGDEKSDALKFLLFIIIVFCVSIPIIISNVDGSQLGPRFLAPLIPALAVIAFKAIELNTMSVKLKRIITRVLIAYSIMLMAFGVFKFYRSNQIAYNVNTNIAGFVRNKVVIVYKPEMFHSIWPLHDGHIVLLIDPAKDWNEILRRTKQMGINDYTVIDFADGKDSIPYPFKESQVEVKDRNFYDGKYILTIIENIRVNR